MLENTKYTERRIHVLPLALDESFKATRSSTEVREELGFLADDFVFGVMGRLDPGKGQDTFVKALTLLSDSKVKGLIMGNAKAYAKKMKKQFEDVGYRVQVFLLNAATMGVPQRRERVFFIGLRNDYDLPSLKLDFIEKPIKLKYFDSGIVKKINNKVMNCDSLLYDKCKPGSSLSTVHEKGNRFNSIKLDLDGVCNTIASGSCLYHPVQKRGLQNIELMQIGTYPIDYNFKDIEPQYLIGMSVPPVMTAQISNQIYQQWLKPIKAGNDK